MISNKGMSLKGIIIFSWLSAMLLSGCVSSYYQVGKEHKTVTEILTKSDRLIKQQRWGEVLYILKQAIKENPNEQRLKDKLFAVNFQWTAIKRRLEDWIIVYEVESLLRQRPLLISMSQSKPDDLFLKLRLRKLNSKLNARLKSLLRCTEYQLNKTIKLARRCLESAKRVELTEENKSLLRQLNFQLIARQKNINDKGKLKISKFVADNKAASRTSKIMLARSQIQAHLYYEALMLLNSLMLEDQSDLEVASLKDEASTGRDLEVLQLINHGDKLYREERAIEAISIWQEASRLNPKDLSIKRRIERARKVIENLEEFSN